MVTIVATYTQIIVNGNRLNVVRLDENILVKEGNLIAIFLSTTIYHKNRW